LVACFFIYAYSSTTKAKTKYDATIKITSKAMIIPSQVAMLPQVSPERASPEALTALIIIGETIGRKRTGNTISRALVLTAMAANVVPIATNPIVAKKVVITTSGDRTDKLNKRVKADKAMISTMIINIRLPSILPI
jgi:hypothetical protein